MVRSGFRGTEPVAPITGIKTAGKVIRRTILSVGLMFSPHELLLLARSRTLDRLPALAKVFAGSEAAVGGAKKTVRVP
jgi:hypothetical protein